jgi:hypothetical protein
MQYLFKPRIRDCNHLVVVLSGFGPRANEDHYDWRSALSKINSAVLWIMDNFDGRACYYMCKEGDFSPAEETKTFIDEILSKEGLSRDQCTLLGLSKGGTAALYLSAKYGYTNVISCVPQSRIGSFISGNSPSRTAPYSNAGVMLGSLNSSDLQKRIQVLDDVLINSIRDDSVLEKNVYILTSRKDPQYNDHIKPLIPEIEKYKNACVIHATSQHIRHHGHVAGYTAQVMLGILYQLQYGLRPVVNEDITQEAPSVPNTDANFVLSAHYDAARLHMRVSCHSKNAKLCIDGLKESRYIELTSENIDGELGTCELGVDFSDVTKGKYKVTLMYGDKKHSLYVNSATKLTGYAPHVVFPEPGCELSIVI